MIFQSFPAENWFSMEAERGHLEMRFSYIILRNQFNSNLELYFKITNKNGEMEQTKRLIEVY